MLSYLNQQRTIPPPYKYSKQPFSMVEPTLISTLKSNCDFKPPAGLVENLAAMEEEDRLFLIRNPTAVKGLNFAKKDITHYHAVENYQLYPNLYSASTFNDVAIEYTLVNGKFVRTEPAVPLLKVVTSYINIYAYNPQKYVATTAKLIEDHFAEVDSSMYEEFITILYEKCYRIDIDESKITKQLQYYINQVTILHPRSYVPKLISTLKKCFKVSAAKHSIFDLEVPVIYDDTTDTVRAEIKDLEEKVTKTKEYYKNSCRFLLAIMDMTCEMTRPTCEGIYTTDISSGSLFSEDQTMTLGKILFKFIKSSVTKANTLAGYMIIVNSYAGEHHNILIDSVLIELESPWFKALPSDSFTTYLLKELNEKIVALNRRNVV